uniref:Endoplasmic reticulum transmembrane protein n=1 Tax=Quercus lobata TaxID=97700 RepID=A0A7N2R1F0_QUELO
MALILTLLFKTPLRKLVIITLDRLKRGRGPIMVKTIAATVLVVLTSTVYSIIKIQNRRGWRRQSDGPAPHFQVHARSFSYG